jgi:hypothetical protein
MIYYERLKTNFWVNISSYEDLHSEECGDLYRSLDTVKVI